MAWADYLRYVLALVAVLALIALAAWAVRRFGLAGAGTVTRPGRRRLAVVEVLPIDAKHRLVLVRRDQVEHLVLLGGAYESIVETGIWSPTESGPVPAAQPRPRPAAPQGRGP